MVATQIDVLLTGELLDAAGLASFKISQIRANSEARPEPTRSHRLDKRHRGSNVFNATFVTRRFRWFHRVERPRRLVQHSFGLQHSGKAMGGSPGAAFEGRISRA